MTQQTQQENTEEYNGWTNRETWAFMLHLSNDHGTYLAVYGDAEQILEEAEPSEYLTAQEEAEREIEDMLEDWYDRVRHDTLNGDTAYSGMVEDVGSHWRINYRECAKAIIEELQE